MNSLNKNGFTLVETLVAITILMIAIAGPLTIASDSLNAALYAKDQVTAAYLAQESMETIKNMRDNTLAQAGHGSGWQGWLTTTPGWESYSTSIDTDGGLKPCLQSSPCDASALDPIAPIVTCPGIQVANAPIGCPLYLSPNGYIHSPGSGVATPFTRYFYVSSPSQPATQCPESTASECEVTVVVSWYEGATQDQVMLTTEIDNTTR